MRTIYGFTAIISKNINKILHDNKNSYENEELLVINNMIDKFKDDKVFNEVLGLFICVDGVILNKKQLINKYAKKDFKELCAYLYKKYSISFIKELRGNFNGFIYDKKLDKYYTFTNQLGNKFLYYYKDDENFIVSSKINEIVNILKMLRVKVELNELSSYFLLTYGYMLDDYTLVKNINKVQPGSYIEIFDNSIKQHQYYFIDNEKYINKNLDELTKELYERFSLATKQAFDKDLEYGYKHIFLLSGGLDSRMIAFFAKKLGYKDCLSVSFAEGVCLDAKISAEISRDLNFEHILYYLDKGNYLKNIDEFVKLNDGQIIYQGLAHAHSILNKINWKDYGMLHNGNSANVMYGAYINGEIHTKACFKNWGFSNKLLFKIQKEAENICKRYKNDELFAIYNRGLACNNGSVSAWNFTETDEVYLNFDLVDYFSKMPPKYKYQEYAFINMINKYMPEATSYTYANWGVKPKVKYLNLMKNKIYKKLKNKYNNVVNKANMNPYDKWIKTNESLNVFVNKYFEENIEMLDRYQDLKKDCKYLFEKGNCSEKLQVLNLLSAYKELINK